MQELGHRSSSPSAKLSFFLSLITHESDYQRAQAASAEKAARRLNVNIEISYADNDAIQQSQQLLHVIHNRSSEIRALIFEPAGNTAFPQVARAAAAAGFGWVVINRSDAPISELRSQYHLPIFIASENHAETGRILGQQIAALLPGGGTVLCLQGPSASPVTEWRMAGMNATKPRNIELKFLRSTQWTEEAGYKAIASWLRLATSHDTEISAVVGQSDLIVLGARRAFKELTTGQSRDRWLRLPFLGINGSQTGQDAVRTGALAATVVVPPSTDTALEALVRMYRERIPPPERVLVFPTSFPALEDLALNAKSSR